MLSIQHTVVLGIRLLPMYTYLGFKFKQTKNFVFLEFEDSSRNVKIQPTTYSVPVKNNSNFSYITYNAISYNTYYIFFFQYLG